jgi:hypothetical protein
LCREESRGSSPQVNPEIFEKRSGREHDFKPRELDGETPEELTSSAADRGETRCKLSGCKAGVCTHGMRNCSMIMWLITASTPARASTPCKRRDALGGLSKWVKENEVLVRADWQLRGDYADLPETLMRLDWFLVVGFL